MAVADLIQPIHIRAFSEQTSKKYGSVVLNPSVKEDVQRAADFLKEMGILDATPHLKSYAFTLGTVIWYPFDVVNPAPLGGWTLPWQIITIAHEHVHVEDALLVGVDKFAKDYVLSSEARAMRWEAKAYCVTAELAPVLFDGWHPDPSEIVSPLVAYGCTAEDIRGAAEVVRLRQAAIKAGGVLSNQARDAIEFLRRSRLYTP